MNRRICRQVLDCGDGVGEVTAFAGAALNVPKRAVHRTTLLQSGDFEDSVAAVPRRSRDNSRPTRFSERLTYIPILFTVLQNWRQKMGSAVLFPTPQKFNSPTPIVVTGAGIVTALGAGWSTNSAGFRAGRVALRPVTLFDVSRQRVKIAGEVSLSPQLPATLLSSREERRLDRATRLLLLATQEALKESGETSQYLPVVLGTSSGGMSLGESFYRQAVHSPKRKHEQPTRVIFYQAQRSGLDLGNAFGFVGPVMIIANACASGANAIGHAWDMLRAGHAERVLAGGYDALSQLVFAGFDSLQALSPTQCRPFDAQRDGLALGEGAGVVILETLDHARQRGAPVLAELVGYGASTDPYHLTQPQPEGKAALASMRAACREANLAPSQINYVNAHGTGTRLNDSAEATAINHWASEHAAQLKVSSTKSSIGHLLGAAGAVEAVVCLMVLQEQWLPPTPTTRDLDPVCRFQLVQNPEAGAIQYALSNSFGFGGANASLIFRRWT